METDFIEMDAKQVRMYLSFYYYQKDGKHVVECPALRTAGIEDSKDEAFRMCKEMTLAIIEHCTGEDTLEEMLREEGWQIVINTKDVMRAIPPHAIPDYSKYEVEHLALTA